MIIVIIIIVVMIVIIIVIIIIAKVDEILKTLDEKFPQAVSCTDIGQGQRWS